MIAVLTLRSAAVYNHRSSMLQASFKENAAPGASAEVLLRQTVKSFRAARSQPAKAEVLSNASMGELIEDILQRVPFAGSRVIPLPQCRAVQV